MSNIVISPQSGVIEFNNGTAGSSSFSTSTAPIRLDATGGNVWFTGSNVGIGTTNPSQKLEVNGAIKSSQYLYLGSDVSLYRDGSNILRTDDALHANGGISVGGVAGGGFIYNRSETDSYIKFDDPNIVMMGGNVGIGNTNPATYKLQVGGEIGVGNYMMMKSSATYMGMIGFNRNGNNGAILNNSYGAFQLQNHNGVLNLECYNSGGVIQAEHAFKEDGKVGIGTTNPQTILHTRTSDNQTARFESTTTSSKIYIIDATLEGKIGVNDSIDTLSLGFEASEGDQPLHISTGGNVGIGTASPISRLNIKSSATSSEDSALTITQNGGSNTIFAVGERATNGAQMLLFDGGTATHAFYTDGTNNYINAGNVGIGTTNPASILDVNGGSANGAKIQAANAATEYVLNAATSNGTSRLWVGGAGNVGIGTVDPARNLSVASSSTNALIQLANSTTTYAADNGLEIFISDNDAGIVNRENGYLRFDTNNLERVRIEAGGNVGIGTTNPQTKLTVGSDGDEDGLEVRESGNLKFKVRPSSSHGYLSLYDSSTNEDIRLNSNGNSWIAGGSLGVGMSSPSARLELKGGTSDSSANAFIARNSSSTSLLSVRNDGRVDIPLGPVNIGDTLYLDNNEIWAKNSNNLNVKADGLIRIQPQSYGTAATFATDGNVGIGSSSPAYKLDVDGTIHGTSGNFETAITINGNPVVTGSSASEGDTLATVTARGASTSSNLSLDGNITVASSKYIGIGSTLAAIQFGDGSVGNETADLSFVTNSDGEITFNRGGNAAIIGADFNIYKDTTIEKATPILKLDGTSNAEVIIDGGSSSESLIRFKDNGAESWILRQTNSNNKLAFRRSSTDHVVLDNAGNLGVGTDTPGATLDLRGDMRLDSGGSTDRSIYFRNQSSVAKVRSDAALQFDVGVSSSPSVAMYIEEDTRYVGIGTNNPTGTLHVYNTNTTSDGDGTATMNATGQDSIVLYGHGGVDEATYGGISWMGGSTRRRAMITAVAENTDTDFVGLAFYTQGTDGAGDFSESMRITRDGDVGIGTTSVNAGIGLQLANGSLYVTNGTANIHHIEAQYFGAGQQLKLAAGQNADLKLMHYNTVDVTVKSDGKVGIGVTNPAKQLTLNAADPFLRLEESSSGGNKRLDLFVSNSTGVIGANQSAQTMMFQTVGENRMTIRAGGNVGIGATNPTDKLEVQSDVGNPMMHLRPNAASTALNPIILYRNQLNGSANYMLCQGTNTFFGTYNGGAPTDESEMIRLAPSSSDAPSIRIGDAGSTSSYLQVGGNIKLLNNGTSYINGGDVGIGTTGPAQKLHLEFSNTDTSFAGGGGGSWGSEGLLIENTSSTADTMAIIQLRNNDADIHIAGIRQGTDDNDLGFFFEASEKVRFTHDGNVGIGTQTPAYKLDVIDSDGGTLARFKDSDSSHAGLIIQGDVNGGSITNASAFTSEVIYLQNSANAMRFYTDGTEAVRIDSSQRVGIGTNSVNGFTHINGRMDLESPSVPSILAISDSGDATKNLRLGYEPTWDVGCISASDHGAGWKDIVIAPHAGKVGIGTTAPHQALSVKGTIVSYNTSYVQVAGMTNSSNAGRLYANNAGGVSKVLLDSNGDSYLDGGNLGIGTTSPAKTLTVDGTIGGTAFGIADGKGLLVDGSPSDDQYARFTANGLEGRSVANLLSDLSLDSELQNLSSAEIDYLEAIYATDVTSTEFDYLDGVTSNIQTQLNNRYTESEMQTIMEHSYISKEGANDLAVGWYTIATNTGNRAVARFGIWDTDSSRHQSVIFYAAHKYGNASADTITVLDTSHYGTSPFRYIRIKAGGTYDGAALQVYIDNSQNALNAAILGDNFQSDSWVLCDFIPDADTPPLVSNYGSFTESSRIDLDEIAQGGFATTGPIYADGNTTQYKVLTTNDFGISDGNAIKCGGSVSDNDFLKIDGTEVEGRTASEVKSDLSLGSSDDVSFGSLTIDSLTHIDTDGTYGATYGAIGIGTTTLTNGHHRIFAKSSDHMYFAASTSKGFRFRPNGGATSASAGVTIASDGDVGIGTTGPANKLDIYGSLAVGASFVGVSAPSDGAIFNGNVGIGTSSVSNKLDVAGGIAIGSSYAGVSAPSNGAIIEGYVGIGTSSNSYYPLYVNGTLYATSKYFIIDHPVPEKKAQHKKLLHACIEGPEVAVYFRGKNDLNIIKMPDYWDSLVHIDSMTVELTPIGANQDIYVDSIADNGDVTIGANTDAPLNYFYVVYGERKDVDKLEPEIVDPEYAD